jgi:hypothetical protein
MQLGFGGRHVIKTTIAGTNLTHALARHQRWLDRHLVVDETAKFDTRAVLDAFEKARGARRQPLKLRMAKARVRPETR